MTLARDVEALLKQMAKKLEDRAECEKSGEDDVSISGKDRLAREYADKVMDLLKKTGS